MGCCPELLGWKISKPLGSGYDEESVCPSNISDRAVTGVDIPRGETLEYLTVLTRIPPQRSPVLVIDLAVAFYQVKVEVVPREGTWPP